MSKTEYGRVRVSSNSHSIHFPKTNTTLPISFTISKIHFTGFYSKSWDEREVRVFNDDWPHPKLYHYFHSTLIYSLLTYKFAVYFLTTVILYICFLFVTCTCRQRNKFSNTLRFRLVFIFIIVSPPSFSSLFCLERLCMDFYLIQHVNVIPSYRAEKHIRGRKRHSTADLPRAAVFFSYTQCKKKLKNLFRNKWKKQMGLF